MVVLGRVPVSLLEVEALAEGEAVCLEGEGQLREFSLGVEEREEAGE